ncbi:MAG: hypothetical protein EOO45_28720 [Flavobacterium sp.]|nr:MAG: hypothetical protein EOO45_28720 [Flavobacterium sp.]
MANQPQNYKNHIRFYAPHHFVFYPLMLALLGSAIWFGSKADENRTIWIFITILIVVVIWVAFMMRQHYALTLQNRIVLMELRYRYHVLTGKRLESIEGNLNEGQLFALRFAPDEELEGLAQRAVQERLSPDAIKKAIKNWKADDRRV